jgi:hypothetical protein
MPVDHSEWRAKFMGDHGDELPLKPIQFSFLVQRDLQIPGIRAENDERFGHVAKLVRPLCTHDVEIELTAGQAPHDAGHAGDVLDHVSMNEQPEHERRQHDHRRRQQ